MRTEYTDRVVYEQHRAGADWGNAAVVLVRLVVKGNPVKELWWQRAGKHWANRMVGYTSHPAELCLAEPQTHKWAKPYIQDGDASLRTLHEGGRLSKALLAQYAQQINEFFGQDVVALIDPKRTLVLSNDPRNLLKGAPVTARFQK